MSDENAKTSILDALNAVFGEDKVKSNISVDQNVAVASWSATSRPRCRGSRARMSTQFKGETVDVGGSTMGDSARDVIIAALNSALGGRRRRRADGQDRRGGRDRQRQGDERAYAASTGFLHVEDLLVALDDGRHLRLGQRRSAGSTACS